MIRRLLVGLLMAGFCVSEAKVKTIPTCRETGDVVFALDGSESIKSKNFLKLKEFASKVVDSFEISEDKIKVGAMVYSTLVREYFDPMNSVANIKSNISGFSYPKNTSRTDLALAYMRQRLLKTSRARVGVIITDGDSKYPDLTKSEAEGARKEGISLIAIGVGSELEEEAELENIAGSKARYRVVKNFDDLVTDATIQDIQTLICNVLKTSTRVGTPVVRDEIVIDPLCEGCIIANGFGYNAFKQDCSKFVQCYPSQDSKGLKIVTSAVKQCAYKTFWSQDDLACVGQEDTECNYSICDGKPDGTTYPYLGCRTYWDCNKGLQEAKYCAAGHHYDNRKGACVVGIPILCSGVDCGEAVGAGKKKLRVCEFEANKNNLSTYYQTLRISATNSSKVLRSCAPGTIFDEMQCSCILDTNGIAISKSTDCGTSPLQADIHFLLDSSGSVGAPDFEKMKQFVAKYAQSFSIGPKNVQIGVTIFSSGSIPQFFMKDHSTRASLVSAINAIQFNGGGTATDLALKWVDQNAFTSAAGDRAGAVNILVVLTDGQSNNPLQTAIEAQTIHSHNITVFAIGIGSGIGQKELDAIATDNAHTFTVQNFDALDTLQEQLKKSACKVKETASSSSHSTGKENCNALVSQESMLYGKTRNVEVSSSGDVITFNHKDHINIWRLANHEFQDSLGVTFSVKLKPYTSRTGSETEQIMINCLHSDRVKEGDDCSASISIQVKKFYGYYTFKGELHTIDIETGRNSSRVLNITVGNTSGYNGYIHVVFAYDGQNFAMKVDGSESSTRLSGWVQRRQTGFIFGRPMLVKGPIQFLDGSIREIEIFDCISDEIRDALRVM